MMHRESIYSSGRPTHARASLHIAWRGDAAQPALVLRDEPAVLWRLRPVRCGPAALRDADAFALRALYARHEVRAHPAWCSASGASPLLGLLAR
jgi:hypothetical protein